MSARRPRCAATDFFFFFLAAAGLLRATATAAGRMSAAGLFATGIAVALEAASAGCGAAPRRAGGSTVEGEGDEEGGEISTGGFEAGAGLLSTRAGTTKGRRARARAKSAHHRRGAWRWRACGGGADSASAGRWHA